MNGQQWRAVAGTVLEVLAIVVVILLLVGIFAMLGNGHPLGVEP